MASLRGRYFSARDINFINSINAELMGDIIETLVTVFKIAASETKVNLYGESAPSEGKTFYPGIDISCLIDRGDISGEDEGFGPLGGQDTKSHSFICNTHYSRLSKLNIFERQV